MITDPDRQSTHRGAAGAAALDLLGIVVFVAVGRHSHDESGAIAGFLRTLWPFVAGAAVGWLVSRGWRAGFAVRPTGVSVWLGAVIGGMLLRAASGQGVAASFVVVATIVLGLLLLGWRAAIRLGGRARS